jgi:integrase
VLAACRSEWFKTLVATAVYTGIRRGELLGLRWDDVDFATGWIHVQRSFDQPTKSGKVRRVPIAAKLEPVLKAWRECANGALVFPVPETGLMATPKIKLTTRLATACRAAGVPVVRFHDLRHTFASHFMMFGGDLYRLQKYLGHSTPLMTQRYAHLTDDHLLAADRDRLSFDVPASTLVAVPASVPEETGENTPLHTPCTQAVDAEAR